MLVVKLGNVVAIIDNHNLMDELKSLVVLMIVVVVDYD
jgi:hypothetical protein